MPGRALALAPENVNNCSFIMSCYIILYYIMDHTIRIRALALDPENVNTLCNYGWMLHDVRRDHDGAEKLYKRVMLYCIILYHITLYYISLYYIRALATTTGPRSCTSE